jgi:hypothetical protein
VRRSTVLSVPHQLVFPGQTKTTPLKFENSAQAMFRKQYLKRGRLVIPDENPNITSFRGQASLAKMTSLGGKLTALASHLTKRVNKAEELTYLSLQTLLGTLPLPFALLNLS